MAHNAGEFIVAADVHNPLLSRKEREGRGYFQRRAYPSLVCLSRFLHAASLRRFSHDNPEVQESMAWAHATGVTAVAMREAESQFFTGDQAGALRVSLVFKRSL
jgi:hypothetical protein